MEHRKNKNRKRNQILLGVLALVLMLGLGTAVYIVQKQADSEVIPEAGTSWNADHTSEYIVYQDKQYPVIRRLSTLLLIGTDKESDDDIQEDLRNHAQSDFLVVLVFDHDRKTVTPLQFNRDTVCETSWLDENGKVGGWKTEHLAFAHTYGSGREDSGENTVRVLRKLIYDAPVDHYLSFTMDAVPLLNDLVGGVTITLDEDIPALGEEYKAGSSVTLKGPEVLRFIRYRERLAGSNYYRMARHRLYLAAFLDSARAAAAKNQDLVLDAFKAIDPFICTDLTANSLSEMADQLCEYEVLDILSPEGSIVAGAKFYEFHPDEESLWNCIYTAYCRK